MENNTETFEQEQARVKAERKERYLAMESKIKSIAKILGFELDNRNEEYYWGFNREISRGNKKLWVVALSYGTKDRIMISGSYPRDAKGSYINPYGYNESRADKISVAASKTPEQIAKDITKRLLPEVERCLGIVQKQIDQNDNYHSSRKETIKYVADKTGFNYSDHKEDGCIYQYEDELSIDVEPRSEGRLEIKLSGVSKELAVKILKLLK